MARLALNVEGLFLRRKRFVKQVLHLVWSILDNFESWCYVGSQRLEQPKMSDLSQLWKDLTMIFLIGTKCKNRFIYIRNNYKSEMPSWGRGSDLWWQKFHLSFPLESAIYQPLKLKARNLYGVTHGLLFRWRRRDRFSTAVVLSAASAIDLKRTNCRFKVLAFFFEIWVCLWTSFANGANFKEQASDLLLFLSLWLIFCLYDLYLPSSFTTAA